MNKRGKQIMSLQDLFIARLCRRAVVCEAFCFSRPRAAAFMMNLPGAVLHKLMAQGMWVYERP